ISSGSISKKQPLARGAPRLLQGGTDALPLSCILRLVGTRPRCEQRGIRGCLVFGTGKNDRLRSAGGRVPRILIYELWPAHRISRLPTQYTCNSPICD
ncbi:MAG: hypothetical protein ACRDIE_00740, partial [Chloroflexota bacterium]